MWKIHVFFLGDLERARGPLSAGPGDALLRPAEREQTAAAAAVHLPAGPVPTRGPHHRTGEHPTVTLSLLSCSFLFVLIFRCTRKDQLVNLYNDARFRALHLYFLLFLDQSTFVLLFS